MSDVWTERLKAAAIVITAIAALAGAVIGGLNHDKIGTVQEHQQVNAQKIDDTKKAAEDVKQELKETTKALKEMP